MPPVADGGEAADGFVVWFAADESTAARFTRDGWLSHATLHKNARFAMMIPYPRILTLRVRCTNRGKPFDLHDTFSAIVGKAGMWSAWRFFLSDGVFGNWSIRGFRGVLYFRFIFSYAGD